MKPAVARAVLDRAAGHCERCGVAGPTQLHHRRPRGMGGTRRPDTVHNLAALCRGCHEEVESRRAQALADGWLLRQNTRLEGER